MTFLVGRSQQLSLMKRSVMLDHSRSESVLGLISTHPIFLFYVTANQDIDQACNTFSGNVMRATESMNDFHSPNFKHIFDQLDATNFKPMAKLNFSTRINLLPTI